MGPPILDRWTCEAARCAMVPSFGGETEGPADLIPILSNTVVRPFRTVSFAEELLVELWRGPWPWAPADGLNVGAVP